METSSEGGGAEHIFTYNSNYNFKHEFSPAYKPGRIQSWFQSTSWSESKPGAGRGHTHRAHIKYLLSVAVRPLIEEHLDPEREQREAQACLTLYVSLHARARTHNNNNKCPAPLATEKETHAFRFHADSPKPFKTGRHNNKLLHWLCTDMRPSTNRIMETEAAPTPQWQLRW